MSRSHWNWSVGAVALEARSGDLLEAPENAWVNSEQTDFILAYGGGSVSAQLRQRWPKAQKELNALTGGHILGPGTVLPTTGPAGRTIFHAGFHAPNAWYFGQEDELPVHLDAIRNCVDQIFDLVLAGGIESVAFPLIGTGAFGVPVERFAGVFFDAVASFGRRAPRHTKVSLCVPDGQDLDAIVQAGTQALAARVASGERLLGGEGGHPLVQALRHRVRMQSDADIQERDLLRFAELALATDLAVAAGVKNAKPADVLGQCRQNVRWCNLTFGLVRDRLNSLRSTTSSMPQRWIADRLSFLSTKQAEGAIGRLVKDRNDYAHHRLPRTSRDIIDDVECLFGPNGLASQWPHADGPWIRAHGSSFALLYGVDFVSGMQTWLVPETRQHLQLPAPL